MYKLYIANKNYSSWSLRAWLLMRELGLTFEEEIFPFTEDSWEVYKKRCPGGLVDGAMVMVGELYNYGSDEAFDFRCSWSENGDGSVRQFFEQYNDETGMWEVWFDGRYVRQSVRE